MSKSLPAPRPMGELIDTFGKTPEELTTMAQTYLQRAEQVEEWVRNSPGAGKAQLQVWARESRLYLDMAEDLEKKAANAQQMVEAARLAQFRADEQAREKLEAELKLAQQLHKRLLAKTTRELEKKARQARKKKHTKSSSRAKMTADVVNTNTAASHRRRNRRRELLQELVARQAETDEEVRQNFPEVVSRMHHPDETMLQDTYNKSNTPEKQEDILDVVKRYEFGVVTVDIIRKELTDKWPTWSGNAIRQQVMKLVNRNVLQAYWHKGPMPYAGMYRIQKAMLYARTESQFERAIASWTAGYERQLRGK